MLSWMFVRPVTPEAEKPSMKVSRPPRMLLDVSTSGSRGINKSEGRTCHVLVQEELPPLLSTGPVGDPLGRAHGVYLLFASIPGHVPLRPRARITVPRRLSKTRRLSSKKHHRVWILCFCGVLSSAPRQGAPALPHSCRPTIYRSCSCPSSLLSTSDLRPSSLPSTSDLWPFEVRGPSREFLSQRKFC